MSQRFFGGLGESEGTGMVEDILSLFEYTIISYSSAETVVLVYVLVYPMWSAGEECERGRSEMRITDYAII